MDFFGFALYFGSLGVAFWFIIYNYRWLWNQSASSYWIQRALLLLALYCLVNTWSHIYEAGDTHFQASGVTFERWLALPDNRLVMAYELVTQSIYQWALSSQLLYLVIAIVISQSVDAQQHGLHRYNWSFIIVGFLGAISVMTALFFSQLIAITAYDSNSEKTKKMGKRHSRNSSSTISSHGVVLSVQQLVMTSVCVLVSIISVVLLYDNHKAPFYPFILMLVHVFLALPGLLFPMFHYTSNTSNTSKYSVLYTCVWLSCLYAFIAASSFTNHFMNACAIYSDLLSTKKYASVTLMEAVTAVYKSYLNNPCQISITNDLCFTQLIVFIYAMHWLSKKGYICRDMFLNRITQSVAGKSSFENFSDYVISVLLLLLTLCIWFLLSFVFSAAFCTCILLICKELHILTHNCTAVITATNSMRSNCQALKETKEKTAFVDTKITSTRRSKSTRKRSVNKQVMMIVLILLFIGAAAADSVNLDVDSKNNDISKKKKKNKNISVNVPISNSNVVPYSQVVKKIERANLKRIKKKSSVACTGEKIRRDLNYTLTGIWVPLIVNRSDDVYIEAPYDFQSCPFMLRKYACETYPEPDVNSKLYSSETAEQKLVRVHQLSSHFFQSDTCVSKPFNTWAFLTCMSGKKPKSSMKQSSKLRKLLSATAPILSTKRILFIGDSLIRQMFLSISCLIHSDLSKMDISYERYLRKDLNLKKRSSKKECTMKEEIDKGEAMKRCTYTFATVQYTYPFDLTMEYAYIGKYNEKVMKHFLDYYDLQATDTLVFNIGAFYNQHIKVDQDDFTAHMRHFFDSILERQFKGTVILRELSPPHFANKGGIFRGHAFNDDCGPVNPSDGYRFQHKVTTMLIDDPKYRELNVVYMPVYDAAITQWDKHFGLFGHKVNIPISNSDKTSVSVTDCNHWCLPSNVGNQWASLFFSLICPNPSLSEKQ